MTNSKNIKADAKAERLATALRANLRLRKAQSRTIDSNPADADSDNTDQTKK